MRKFVVILFGLASAVSEEQQAGVEATKTEVISTLEKIGSGDATRQIVLRSAIKTVSELGSTITPGQYDKLQNVSDLLDQILTLFSNEVTARQGYITGLLSEMAGCDTKNASDITTQTGTISTLKDAHRDCRAEHYNVFQTMQTKHQNLKHWQTEVETDDAFTIDWTRSTGDNSTHISGFTSNSYDLMDACELPTADEASIIDGTWERFIQATLAWFQNFHTEFIQVANHYTTAAVTQNSKRTECNNDQEAYEQEVCSLKTNYGLICGIRQACWTSATNSQIHNNLDDFIADNTNVPELVRLVKYIQCIIAEIQVNDTDTTAAARETCAWWMSAECAPTSTNPNYTGYYIDLSGLESSSAWPTAANCEDAQYTELQNYLPFTFSSGAATSYRDDIESDPDYSPNSTVAYPAYGDTYWSQMQTPAAGGAAHCTNIADPTP